MKKEKGKGLRQKLMKNKLFMTLSVVLVISLITFATAFYYFGYDKTISYSVVGEGGDFVVLLDLQDMLFNVSQDVAISQDFIVENKGLAQDMILNIARNYTGSDPTCNNGEEDIYFSFRREGSTGDIPDGSTITLDAGINNFSIYASAGSIPIPSQACPGTHTIEIHMTPVA